MSFVWFEQFSNIFKKKLYVKKVISLISYENNERMNFFPTQARSKILFDLEIYLPWGNLTMSLVLFDQIPNLLKKAIYEKVNLLISYENNEKNELFSTQPRSEILFDLESPFH